MLHYLGAGGLLFICLLPLLSLASPASQGADAVALGGGAAGLGWLLFALWHLFRRHTGRGGRCSLPQRPRVQGAAGQPRHAACSGPGRRPLADLERGTGHLGQQDPAVQRPAALTHAPWDRRHAVPRIDATLDGPAVERASSDHRWRLPPKVGAEVDLEISPLLEISALSKQSLEPSAGFGTAAGAPG